MFLAHKIELRPTKEQEQLLTLLLIYKVWTGSSRTIIAWKSPVRLLAAWALTTGILVFLTKLRTDDIMAGLAACLFVVGVFVMIITAIIFL